MAVAIAKMRDAVPAGAAPPRSKGSVEERALARAYLQEAADKQVTVGDVLAFDSKVDPWAHHHPWAQAEREGKALSSLLL